MLGDTEILNAYFSLSIFSRPTAVSCLIRSSRACGLTLRYRIVPGPVPRPTPPAASLCQPLLGQRGWRWPAVAGLGSSHARPAVPTGYGAHTGAHWGSFLDESLGSHGQADGAFR